MAEINMKFRHNQESKVYLSIIELWNASMPLH